MGRTSRYAGPSLTLARSWGGYGRGARACALKMKGLAGRVLRSEVFDCDAVRSEDVVDADKGGMRLNASAITTVFSVGERRAGAMAIIGAKPTQNMALTCARKL
jgi:hypothetical protein